MHLKHGAAGAGRADEEALVACLRAHADHDAPLDHVYLVGDVFDQYIEYRHLIPKGWARLQGLLATWTDRGIPVTYLAGNHDPWHRDYFRRELGVRLVMDALLEPVGDTVLYAAHGDAVAAQAAAYTSLRPVLRHPVPVWLYRTLLPGDAGMALARWVNTHIHDTTPDPAVVAALHAHAATVLHETAARVAVLGHSHVPALHAIDDGYYLNPGAWYESRTFGRLDDEGLHLLRWTGSQAVSLDVASFL